MANVLMTEGFDMYNGQGGNIGLRAKWIVGAANATAPATNGPILDTGLVSSSTLSSGRFGGQCWGVTSVEPGGNQTIQGARLFDATGTTTTMAIGVAIYVTSFSSGDTFFQVDSSGSFGQFSLGYTNTGQIFAASGSNGTVLCTSSSSVIPNSTWVYVEAEVVLNGSTGSVSLYVSGSLVASATGVNTLAAGGGAAYVRLLGRSNGHTMGVYFDDIYVVDAATRLGECRVETLRPTADNTANWTASSGSNNYSRINESLVDGDTSYVQTAATNLRDLYTHGSLSSTPASIFAVNVISFAEKTDATTRQLYNSVRSGSTDSDGPAFNLGASYGRFDRVIQIDPNTSATWTAAGVNNLLFGPKAA